MDCIIEFMGVFHGLRSQFFETSSYRAFWSKRSLTQKDLISRAVRQSHLNFKTGEELQRILNEACFERDIARAAALKYDKNAKTQQQLQSATNFLRINNFNTPSTNS